MTTRTIALGFLTIAGCALAATTDRAATTEGADKELIRVTKTEHADFAPGGTIRISGAHGDVNVEGWERPEVEVTVIKSTKRLYTPKEAGAARKRLDLFAVKLDRKSGTEVDISTTMPRRKLTRPNRGASDLLLEYQIHVPGSSHLVIHNDTGDILISNVAGDIEAIEGTGDIVLVLPGPDSAYSIDAKTRFGNVESDFGGAARSHLFVTRELAFAPASPKHRVFLRVGVGGITIK